MAFLSCGGAWSMHLGLHSQHISKCTLPQARAHGQTNRLLALQCRTLGRRVAESELFTKGIQFVPLMGRKKFASCVCLAGGPRPRKPRIWKSRVRKGTVAKGDKLLECIKALSNVKEEVYGALDSFIAWEVEFPLIAVKKALKALEAEKEWKRVIQVAKWMLSKGQGKTMGTYYLLLGALAEDGRIEEAEELWSKIFKRHLEYVPRRFFSRVIIMYDRNNMPEKLLEVFADMEELGVKPDYPTVIKVANTLKKMGMLDKYDKVLKKYPPPKWEYRYDKHKRIKVRVPARHVSGEELIPLNDNSSNNLDEDDSVVDALITAEGTEQQTEVSQSLEETDLTRVPVST